MNRHTILSGGVLGAAIAAMTWTTASRADTTVVETPPSSPAPVAATPVAERDAYTGPNRRLITSGLVTFGLSYIPAVIVAGTSDTSADHHLYVPIVGPWLDLGDRPGCGPHIGCDTETTNKVLLVVDGLFQGIGAVTTVWGFLTPERHEVVSTAAVVDKPTVHVSPSSVGASGYGLTAFGSF
jgi:hypothetical protein